jgi:hypothetical protein
MSAATTGIAPFSRDADFDFEIRTALGQCEEGAGIPGEILATAPHVRRGDHEGWYATWRALGDRAGDVADAAAEAGHPASAAGAYLRASAYLSVAVNATSALADDDRMTAAFRSQRSAWESFVDLAPADVDRVTIPYEGGTMPGYLFRQGAGSSPARTLVAVNGSDGSLAGLWAAAVAPALRRGWNVLVFDGPGQQSMLFDKGIPFRPDWEHVLTPVFDALAARDDVDAERIALYGISQGGYWVARGITAEHRFAAAVTDPGVTDVAASWTRHIPGPLLTTLDTGDDAAFDREMALGMRFSTGTRRTWRFRARPYGTTGYADTIRAVREYTVVDTARLITAPLLVLSPEGEQFWPGQAEQLAALAPEHATLVRFTAAEGADGHCQPLARALTAQRMFDWLDELVR